jgi:HEAT repeat protein
LQAAPAAYPYRSAKGLVVEESLRDASVDDLLAALDEPGGERRGVAAQRLVFRGERQAEVLARLVRLRADSDYLVRAALARALVRFGLPAAEAIPLLRELLEDEDDFVSRQAAGGLERLGQGSCTELRKGRKRPRRSKPGRRDFYWPSSGHPD